MGRDYFQPLSPATESNHCSVNAFVVVMRGDDPRALTRSQSAHHYQLRLTGRVAGTVTVGDYAGNCDPFSLFLLGPDLAYSWSSSNHEDAAATDIGWLISFSETSIQRLVQVMPELSALLALLSRSSQGLQFAGQTLQSVRQLVQALVVACDAERVLLLLQLLQRLAPSHECCSLVTAHHSPPGDAKIRARIQAVVSFLNKHFAQDLSLESVASRHGMSASHLSRLFKQATGSGFCEFLIDLRIRRACELLSCSERPITEICFDIGFKNISNFNRRFVALTQRTPTEYRRALSG